MTSYVTREEYDRLNARLERLEAGLDVKVSGYVLSADGDVERVIRQQVRAGLASYGRHFDRSIARRA